MRGNTWTNADGLVVEFGTRDLVNLEAGVQHAKGNTKEIEMDLYFNQAVTALQPKAAQLPAGAVITSARVLVEDAFVGGTNIQIGLDDVDGLGADLTDADALVAATVTANLTAGASIEGAGVRVDGTALEEDCFLTYTIAGTYTAGQARLVVEYI